MTRLLRCITMIDGKPVTTMIPDDGTIFMEPDRSLSEREFYADAILIEHREYDCGGGEGCSSCLAARRAFDEVRAEVERRERAGFSIEDPDEPTLEERLGPYGLEWQREQEERRYW